MPQDYAEDADLFELAVKPGDLVIAASDGVWDNARDEELLQYIDAGEETDVDQVGHGCDPVEPASKMGLECDLCSCSAILHSCVPTCHLLGDLFILYVCISSATICRCDGTRLRRGAYVGAVTGSVLLCCRQRRRLRDWRARMQQTTHTSRPTHR